MKRICVFCGSSAGENGLYKEGARELGIHLSGQNIELVYGGGNVGLMGILADSVLENGGTCIGVIPDHIFRLEIAHTRLTELIVVESMHERKAKMAALADGFIALPGGFGTLDELSEVLTYNQLRIFDKPIGLLNINGYFNGLLEFFDHSVSEHFVRQEHRNNILVSDHAADLIKRMESYRPVQIGKWIDEIRDERKTSSKESNQPK